MDELHNRIEKFNNVLEKYREVGFKVGVFNPNTPSAVPLLDRFENFEKIMRDNIKAMITHELVELERQIDNMNRMGIKIPVNTAIAGELDKKCETGDVLSEDTIEKIKILKTEINNIQNHILNETAKLIEKLKRIENEINLLPPETRDTLIPQIRRAYERFDAKRYYEVWFTARRVIEEYEGKRFGAILAKLNYLTSRVQVLKTIGADVHDAESLLLLAKAQFESREIDKATETIEKCGLALTEIENESIIKNIENFEKYVLRAREVIHIDENIQSQLATLKDKAITGNIESANNELRKLMGELDHMLAVTLNNLNLAWERDINAAATYGIPVDKEQWKNYNALAQSDKLEAIKQMREHLLKLESEIEKRRASMTASMPVPTGEKAITPNYAGTAQVAQPVQQQVQKTEVTATHAVQQVPITPSAVPPSPPAQVLSSDLKNRIENFNQVIAKYLESGVKLRLFDPNAPSQIPLVERFENYEKIVRNNLKAFLAHELIDYERNIDNAKKINLQVEENPALASKIESAIESDNVLSIEVAQEVFHIRELTRKTQNKIERMARTALEDLKKVEEILPEIPMEKEYLMAQINKARDRFEARRYYESYLVADKILKEVEGKTFGLLIPKLEKAAKDIAELKVLGLDTTKAEEHLQLAREKYDARDFIRAQEHLDACNKEIHTIITANISKSVEKFENYVKELDAIIKLDADIWLRIDMIKRAVSEDNTEKASSLLNTEMDKVEEKVRIFVDTLLGSLRNAIESAQVLGKEINAEVLEDLKNRIQKDKIAGIKDTLSMLNTLHEEIKKELGERIKALDTQMNLVIDENARKNFGTALKALIDKAKALPIKSDAIFAWTTEFDKLRKEVDSQIENEVIPKLNNIKEDLKILEQNNFKLETVSAHLKEIEEVINSKNVEEAKKVLHREEEQLPAMVHDFVVEVLKPIYQMIEEIEVYKIAMHNERKELEEIFSRWSPGKLNVIYNEIQEIKKNYPEKLNTRIKSKIETAKKNMGIFQEYGIKSDLYEEYIKNAEDRLIHGEFLECLRNLMHISEVYPKIKAEIIKGTEELNSKCAMLTELGVVSKELPDIILEIQKNIENEDFYEAHVHLKENLAKYETQIKDKIESEIKGIGDAIAEIKKFGTPSEMLTIAYDMAKNLAGDKKYREAKVFIVRCRTLLSQDSMKVFEQEYNEVNRILKVANARGIDTTTASAYLSNFGREISNLHFYQAKWFLETAKRMLDEEIKKLAKMELQSFSDVIDMYSPIFGKEFFTNLQKKLSEIISLYQSGAYIECIDRARTLKDEINRTLNQLLRKELTNITKILEKFESYGLDFTQVRAICAESIAYLDAEKVQDSLARLREGKKLMTQQISEFLNERVADVEDLIENAEKIGGDVTKHREILKNVRHLIEEESFMDAISIIDNAGREVATILHSLVYRKILDVNAGINAIQGIGLAVSEEVKKHRDSATTALANGQYFEALHGIELAGGFLAKNLKAYVSEKLKEISVLLDTGKLVGAEMRETNTLLTDLENAVNMVDVTKVTVILKQLETVPKIEIENHLRVLISETEELASLLEKYGAPHESAREIIIHANNLLGWKNYSEAYYTIQRIRPLLLGELKEKVREELSRYDKILTNLQKLGIDAGEMQQALTGVKDALEKMNVKEFVAQLENLRKISHDLNLKHAEQLKKSVENLLSKIQIDLAKWEKLGLERGEFPAILKKIGELISKEEYIEAAALAQNLESGFDKATEFYVRGIIENVRQKLALARRLGITTEYNVEPLLAFDEFTAREKLEDICRKLIEIEKTLDVENLVKIKALYEETTRVVFSDPASPQGYRIALERAKVMINTGKYLEAYVLIERCRTLLGLT